MGVPLLTTCSTWSYVEQSAEPCERLASVASAKNSLMLAVSSSLWKGRHHPLVHVVWDMSLILSTILCQEVAYSSIRVCWRAHPNCCTATQDLYKHTNFHRATSQRTYNISKGSQERSLFLWAGAGLTAWLLTQTSQSCQPQKLLLAHCLTQRTYCPTRAEFFISCSSWTSL